MSYEKQNFAAGNVLKDEHLNHIEDGIVAVEQSVNNIQIPTVPTKVSELTNDSGYITAADIPASAEVPTKLSELENDMGFVTTAYTETLYAPLTHTHSQYADASHTHAEYAISNHEHTQYASSGHTHSEYAISNHEHTQYASSGHTHSEYALTSHSHSEYVSTSNFETWTFTLEDGSEVIKKVVLTT